MSKNQAIIRRENQPEAFLRKSGKNDFMCKIGGPLTFSLAFDELRKT